ncbi:hypothetical protein FRC06_005861, partial [Ceratobasidium sp. 370]
MVVQPPPKRSPHPAQIIRVPPRVEQNEAEFDTIRAKNENNIKKQCLAQRRTLQAAGLVAQTQSHRSGAESPNNCCETQIDLTIPSTTHATVGINSFAGAHDPLAQELDEDKHQRQEHIRGLPSAVLAGISPHSTWMSLSSCVVRIEPHISVISQALSCHLPQAPPANRAPRPMRPTPEDVDLNEADFDLVTHVIDERLRTHIPGGKPRRTEWHGMVRKLLDRTAVDSKATLLASGFMKTAEERELIITQAWGRANEYFKQPRPHRKITNRQARYVQNLFSPYRKLLKTRLESLVPDVHHLCDGTHEQIAEHANELLPHTFHSHAHAGELGPLHFEHPSLSTAITLAIFQNPRDLGVTFNTPFNLIPAHLLALICAMIADIIGEHGTGTHITKPTCIETLHLLFNTYIGSLDNLRNANVGRLRNLLMWLHDECFAALGTLHKVTFEEPNNVIPIKQFDTTQVEPYQPRYTTDQLLAMMTQ